MTHSTTNNIGKSVSVPGHLVPLLEEAASLNSDATAVIFEDERLSYKDLWARTTQLAAYLQDLHIAPGDVVGVHLERSFDLVASLLATLRAGAAYLPLDPGYPESRISFMLNDAGATVVISNDPVKGFTGTVLDPATQPTCDPFQAPPNKSEDPAYLIYTSGSTGQPKGVAVSHSALANRILWMKDEFAVGTEDIILQKTPFTFDVSIWEFFLPLLAGAKLLLAIPGAQGDSVYLKELISRERVTMMHFVPSMLRIFLAEPDLRAHCSSLRDVVCSGEALPAELASRFFDQLDTNLHNLYGPTEAAIDVTHWRCQDDSPNNVVPIGFPVWNTSIYLLDEAQQPVANGETGELYIGGRQVGLGYRNRPELSHHHFLADPFNAGATMYRTGDLARRRDDGAIEFLGRNDQQIKIRGFRIELGEIAHTLTQLPFVRDTVVIAVEGKHESRIAAFLAPENPDRIILSAEVKRAARESLPDYMIPHFIVPVEHFPITANGKLDRAALPDPRKLNFPANPPRGGLETWLADVWSDLLDVGPIPRDVAFFDFGASSLDAARFVNRVQTELDEHIYVVSLFTHPTVSDYARFLQTDYRRAIRHRFPELVPEVATLSASVIDRNDFAKFEQCIPKLTTRTTLDTSPPNAPAVFILAPPRSGTTLLRVMLAGHSNLFAATELQLLCFHTLAERATGFQDKFSAWSEGLIRSLMDIRGCDAESAKRSILEFEQAGFSTKACYRELQQAISPRILVDKSPSYALDSAVLEKAEEDFRDARYIHLVRHPTAVIDSFVNYHMDQVMYLHDHDFSARSLAELVWTVSHRNVVEFLDAVPAERYCHIKYEDLIREPEASMRVACDAIGIAYEEATIQPYDDIESKMVDGLYADSTPMGDTHLLERTAIEADLADKWKTVVLTQPLAEETIELARRFHYGGLPQELAYRSADRVRKNRQKRRTRIRS